MVMILECDSCGSMILDETRCVHCKKLRAAGATVEECVKANNARLIQTIVDNMRKIKNG